MKRSSLFLTLLLFPLTLVFAANPKGLPTLPKRALNFIVASDMGRRGESQQQNIAAVMGQIADGHRLAFVAVAGDPIHDNGVKSVTDPEWKLKFEAVYVAPSLQQLPWYVVSGNHEYKGSVPAILAYSAVSSRWKAPARYYAIEQQIPGSHEKCLLLFIDTAPLIDKYRKDPGSSDAGAQDMAKELRFIDSTLTVTHCRWKVVIGHHPVFADTGKSQEERADMQARLQPILEKGKADLYVCGHIHNFQYIHPQGSHTHYIVNSSASQSREVQPVDGTQFCHPDPGVTVVSVKRNALLFRFVNHKGEQLYHYTLKK
ncbi:MAG: metallophosphoesterase [Marinilabiliales bacterium]|nr:metallophosphoesterase [Marinilabiliales bacterium]